MKKTLLLTLSCIVMIIFASTSFAAEKKPMVVKGVTIIKPVETKNPIAKKNADTIVEFFSLYLKDKDKFYSLWVKDNPAVITPFVTNDVAVTRVAMQDGWPAVKGFWDPIFDQFYGKFNWTIDEFIVGENPNVIITLSHSDIDVKTGDFWGNRPLKYIGTYVQIFTFENGKVKSFEEYYDTALLNSQYGG